MTNSYCIIYSCSSFCIARANNNRIISTCYLTVITNNNCIISIRYSILRTNSRHMLYIRTSITNAYYKVICAFSTIRTCNSIINTNHRCAQCVVSLVAATESHCSTATFSNFDSILYAIAQFIRIVATTSWCTRNASDRVCNFITCTEY